MFPCLIDAAFAQADASHPYVKLYAGTHIANVTVVGKTVFVHAQGAVIYAASAGRALQVHDGARLRMVGGSVVNTNTGTNGIAIACEAISGGATPTLELEGTTVDAAANITVFGYPCSMQITRSHLLQGSGPHSVLYMISSVATIDRTLIDGGEAVQAEGAGSSLRVTNSILRNQRVTAVLGTNAFGGAAGAAFVSFSTITSLLRCTSGTPSCAGGTEPGVCIDSSIVVTTATDSVQGSGCRVDHSLVSPQSSALTGANNLLNASPAFVNAAGGDYHLSSLSAAIDVANPAGDSPHDYDGTARPQGSGKDMGAFEYKP
jgi:hypothetical protein